MAEIARLSAAMTHDAGTGGVQTLPEVTFAKEHSGPEDGCSEAPAAQVAAQVQIGCPQSTATKRPPVQLQ